MVFGGEIIFLIVLLIINCLQLSFEIYNIERKYIYYYNMFSFVFQMFKIRKKVL